MFSRPKQRNGYFKHPISAQKSTNISPTQSPIFERMQALSNPMENGRSTNISTINATQTPIDLNSVWKIRKYSTNAPILDEECQENETNTNACHLFKMCASNLTFLIIAIDQKIKSKHQNPNDMNTNYNLLNSHHTWSEFITVQVAFYGGLFLGAMVGAIALFAMKLISDCVRMSKCGCASNKQSKFFLSITSNIFGYGCAIFLSHSLSLQKEIDIIIHTEVKFVVTMLNVRMDQSEITLIKIN